MQNHKIKYIFILTIFSIFSLCCAFNKAPENWLAQPNDAQTDVYGGWVEIEYFKSSQKTQLFMGELVALSNDSIYVVDSLFQVIAISQVHSIRLIPYNSNSSMMSGLIVLGTASTISNGLFLIFTMPMWIIGGIIAASTQSFHPIIDYPDEDISRFIPYARYPQGLPLGLDRYKIKMKPIKN